MKILLSVILVSSLLIACVPEETVPTTPTFYYDDDGDGYGDAAVSYAGDTPPVNYVANSTDCDDGDIAINPDATEVNTDLTDHDCDGSWSKAPYAVGDYGPAGGIVFYVEQLSGQGLESSLVDQDGGSLAVWGCFGVGVSGADGTAIGTGAQNTADIFASLCSDAGTAVKLVEAYSLNGYDDWFLPSKDELDILYSQRAVVGGFDVDFRCCYWSSSEVNSFIAWSHNFEFDEQEGLMAKSGSFSVRAIRAF